MSLCARKEARKEAIAGMILSFFFLFSFSLALLKLGSRALKPKVKKINEALASFYKR